MRGEAGLVTSQHPYIYVSLPARTILQKYRCIDIFAKICYTISTD